MSNINIETAIAYMESKIKKITYSMYGCRTGKTCSSGDCSGTIYQALLEGGASSAGWVVNTDYMHDWLIKNGFKLVAANKSWTAKRGDITILGKKGASGGAGGHVFMFTSNTEIIDCSYDRNGVRKRPESELYPAYNSLGYWYTYRYEGEAPKPTTPPKQTISGEVDWSKRAVISYVNESDLDAIIPLVKFLTPSYIVDVIKSGQADFSKYKNSNWRIAIGGTRGQHSGYMNYHIAGKDRKETADKIKDFRENDKNKYRI